MNIFASLPNGDSATWKDYPFSDTQGASYDALVYTLTYELRGAVTLTLTATALGNLWQTAITTTQSTGLTPGPYTWAAYASKTGARVTAGSGRLTITDNVQSAIAGYDGTSQNEKDLAAVKAEISARTSNSFTFEYTIGNRSLKKEAIAALFVLQDRLTRAVRREREKEMIANGQGNPRRVMTRFTQ